MQKNNIRIIVQELYETASDFAERLEKICNDLHVEHNNDRVNVPPFVFLSSASDGRLTAIIQFTTTEVNNTKKATFNEVHLHIAHERYSKLYNNFTNETQDFFNFLLNENINDYIGE